MNRWSQQIPFSDYISKKSTEMVEIVSLAFIAIIALGLRLPGLSRGLLFDEIYSLLYFVRLDSFWQTISTYIEFYNHIAYSIILRLLYLMGAHSDWLVRLPALIFGLASIFVFWRLVRQWLDWKIALIAGFLMAVSPEHVQWSVTGRGYTGMLLFVLISCGYFFKILGTPKHSYWILYIFANVMAIYFHLYAAWVPIIQIIFLVLLFIWQNAKKSPEIKSESFRSLCWSFFAIVALSLLLYAPVFNCLLTNISGRGQSDFQELFPFRLISAMNGGVNVLLQIILFFVATIGSFALWQKARPKVIFSVLLISLPVGMMVFLRPFYLFTRFFIFVSPFYLLMVAVGAYQIGLWLLSLRMPFRRFVVLPILTLMVVISYSWINHAITDISDDGFRAGVMALKSYPEMPVCAIGLGAELFQYYSKKPILIPTGLNEFLGQIEKLDKIVCLYRKSMVVSEGHQQILNFLTQNAQYQNIKNVFIYYYTRPPDR